LQVSPSGLSFAGRKRRERRGGWSCVEKERKRNARKFVGWGGI